MTEASAEKEEVERSLNGWESEFSISSLKIIWEKKAHLGMSMLEVRINGL